jgi:pyrroloquinoline quinone (PQQ) biosynthesis protein C
MTMNHTEPVASAYARLLADTAAAREFLLGAPPIRRALAGDVTRELYVAFLTQAYHHVKYTVPLLMAVGSRIDAAHEWLRAEVAHYVEEEIGHEQWILDDIEAAGGDRAAVVASLPNVETDAMVAYAWDVAQRRNPVGFFGMVFVLEGTSIALALEAAGRVQATLGLPDRAFTYLRSHGELDKQHVQHLAGILERLPGEDEQRAILQCARAMFWLYGHVFRSLEDERPAPAMPRATSRRAA